MCSFLRSFVRSSVRSSGRLFVRSLVRVFVRLTVHLICRSFVRLFVCSFARLLCFFVRSFVGVAVSFPLQVVDVRFFVYSLVVSFVRSFDRSCGSSFVPLVRSSVRPSGRLFISSFVCVFV